MLAALNILSVTFTSEKILNIGNHITLFIWKHDIIYYYLQQIGRYIFLYIIYSLTIFDGALEEIRTPDLSLRRGPRYPTVPPRHIEYSIKINLKLVAYFKFILIIIIKPSIQNRF